MHSTISALVDDGKNLPSPENGVMMNARTVRSDVSADDGDGLVHQKKGVIMAKKRVLGRGGRYALH